VKNFGLMSQDEKDDVIVAFMKSQETDRYCLQLNHDRYMRMLKDLDEVEGAWKNQITELFTQTAIRMEQIDGIMAASAVQMPIQERIDAAMLRMKEREKERVGTKAGG